jgi:hypothetical protein
VSRQQDALLRAKEVIGLMSVLRKWPDPKYPNGRNLTLFDRARELADVWAADRPPKGEPGAERGGSSSGAAKAESTERADIQRRAAAAVDRLARAPELAEELEQMYRDVTYLTTITKERPDVPEETLAGCKSCARAGVTEPVYHKSKVSGLCRWCAEKLDEYDDLPVEAIRVRHWRGPRAATLWLQANAARKDDDPIPGCGTTFTHLGLELRCIRGMGHDGPCRGVDGEGRSVQWERAVTKGAA